MLKVLMWLVVGGGVLVALLFLVALVAEIVQRVVRKRARGRAGEATAAALPADSPPDPPSWRLSLLVDVDEEGRSFRPSVQLRGGPVDGRSMVRLELVDRRGVTRAVSSRSLPPSAIESELALPPFDAPVGVSVEQALAWHWDVVISDPNGEKARWREHPSPAGDLNAEAEIEMPRLRQARPTDFSEDAERRLVEAVLGSALSGTDPPV